MRIKTNIPISLAFIKKALGIAPSLSDKNIIINAISTNSKNLQTSDLFIPLRGEFFDAELFVKDAISRGAYSLSRNISDLKTIKVDSTESALLSIAKEYKRLINPKYTIAITGSVGKTTTKDLTIKLLSNKFKVSGTDSNYNNEIGVPLTIFAAEKDTEVLVIEAGMNHKGELSRLSGVIEPDISVITKIGSAHIGNFDSIDEIAKAKLEILTGMKVPFAIIPYAEPLLSGPFKKMTVSINDCYADIFLSNVKITSRGCAFNLHFGDKIVKDLKTVITGAHIPECLLFAISICLYLGMGDEELRQALSSLTEKISKKAERIGDFYIIDDSYNSSVEAVRYAFQTLNLLKEKKCSAVLGDMLELGSETEKLHKEIGALASRSQINNLYLFGKYSDYIKCGALEYGMNESSIFINTDTESPDITAKQLLSNASPEETILLKGSHKLRMERIKDELKILYAKKEE